MSHVLAELQMKQAAPLSVKIKMTQQRIREWVDHYGLDEVYVSFSGGKDSTVLLTIAREMYPGIKAVFFDTGLEYPEIRDFVKTWDNVDWVKPKMNFKQVIEKYGYPFISKEVSECVYGARKYLTHVAEKNSLDRPTDREPWRYRYERLCGLGEFAKHDKGGQDNKWRRARGLGEYGVGNTETVPGMGLLKNNRQLPHSKDDGNPGEGRQVNDGEYP